MSLPVRSTLPTPRSSPLLSGSDSRKEQGKKSSSRYSILGGQSHLTVTACPNPQVLLFRAQDNKKINCHLREVENLKEKLNSWPKSPHNRPSIFKQQQRKERQENYFLEEAACIADQLIRFHAEDTRYSRKRFNNTSLNCREWYGERCHLIAAMLPPEVAVKFKIIACY
ncbi:hypothetical protein [Synechococcus elongatus]|nr:hypothetical protein [Synechococcus elongatus]ABB56470.1 hypothetical protein Synpcc7942_0438 [Synechococcus elongatus PCC 7942 = FACHB-805]MBD2588948.1 hypothetical protein [Synechococcus elongatus FACHB-242]MBD2690014.1 hypothetical protein [Synechococcus elongatus FACHB-1061]MBD2706985.1 hypothetical protein [Synechococcus elongatus PCC 7942 = FACHB-805]UOW70226.1 hypothetical protein PCC7943_0453 [Synechococcus elongatus PCC 7943]